jgi:hypothetical protein
MAADHDAGGEAPQILELAWGATGSALGLTITFNGGTTVNYGEGKPPAGSVVLLLEHDSKQESVVWMQSDWGDPHQAFGYTYRVLNPPELKPRSVRVEVRKG